MFKTLEEIIERKKRLFIRPGVIEARAQRRKMSGDVVKDVEALVHSTIGKWDASHDAFHALRVRKLALSLAVEESLTPDSMEIIELASLLHDIGNPVERFMESHESHGVESSKKDKIMSIIKTMGFKDELAGVTSGTACYMIQKYNHG